MNNKHDQLAQLRNRAEAALKQVVVSPLTTPQNIDEVIHELQVYHVELELQLEDLQESYRVLDVIRQRYANLFDFAPVGYVVTDNQGIVLNANRTAGSMLRMERNLIERQPFANFITSDFQDHYHLCCRSVLNNRQAQNCEVQLHRSDGSIFHAQLDVETSNLDTGSLFISVTDISTIKQAEEALHRALEQEREINALRSRVLSIISHEFRTPLSIILAAVETLSHYADRLTPEEKEKRLKTIQNLIWYLNDMVQDAQSVNEIGDPPRLHLMTFDVLAFVHQLAQDIGFITTLGQKVLVAVHSTQETESVTWDANLSRRIIMNLLNNALKYSTKDVHCVVECEAEAITLRIQDHGIGITAEDQQHIFEPFYRGQNVEHKSGMGIGLFVVRQAVLAHGGSITCESKIDEGTTFIVKMPRHTPTATPGPVPKGYLNPQPKA